MLNYFRPPPLIIPFIVRGIYISPCQLVHSTTAHFIPTQVEDEEEDGLLNKWQTPNLIEGIH